MFIPNGEWVIISAFNSKIKIGKSLRARILILFILIGLVPVLMVATMLKHTARSSAISSKGSMIRSQSQTLAAQLSMKSYSSSDMPAELEAELIQLGSIIDGRIVLVDKNCRIIKDTFNEDSKKSLISSSVVKAMTQRSPQYTNHDNEQLEFVYPVFDADGVNAKGAFIILASTNKQMAEVNVTSNRITIVEVVCIIALIALSIVFSKLLVNPFEKLSRKIGDISEGYTGEDIKFEGYTEMEKLSDAMNNMVGKMQTLDNSRQEFVSNVSHELKTPITSMKVLADSLLVQEDVPVELYKEFMLDIADEIDRENKIINDLLALVKLDKSNMDLNIAPVTINDTIELILKRLRPIAARRDIELVFESFRPVTAEVDEVKLTLAISNLVENAIKYNVDGGWVHVSLNADHQYFYVKVADSGIGIPEESLENIYERFYRVDKSHSREIGGTGLGLAITRSAILKHRGSIKVYSKEEEGTTFTVRIPLIYVMQ